MGSLACLSLPPVSMAKELADPDAIIVPAADPTNPLAIFRQPITQRMLQLSLQLGTGSRSDLQYIDSCLSYIDGFAVGVASTSTPDAAVLERKGACGTFTKVLLSLARLRGMPGRSVGFYNYPPNNGHTACELFVDGQWRFFDATTHVHYAAKDDPTSPALSYEETKQRYDNGLPVYRIGRNARKGRDRFSGEAIFRNANPQGVIGPEHPMLFPLYLHLHNKPQISVADFGPRNQGAAYIGAAHINNEQLWTLDGLQPGKHYRFAMTPLAMVGLGSSPHFTINTELSSGSNLLSQPLSIRAIDSLAEPYYVSFLSDATSATLKLTHRYRGPEYTYLKAARFRLESNEKR